MRKEMTNEERAQRAETAIAGYTGYDPYDLSATIVDLVVDLMHLAHFNDIEPDYIARISADHYTAEVEEEAEGCGPCAVCQSETTYCGEHNGDAPVWLCPDHGGKP
jgi:hypothetical protein